MNKYKLAIVGSGSLGTIIAEEIIKELAEDYELLGVLSQNKKNSLKLSNRLACKSYDNLDEMIKDGPDYIIEAASPEVVKDMAIKILSSGINFIPLSVGALADNEFYREIKSLALKNNSRIHIPSGAVGGFDVLRSSMLMEDMKISISTEKSPKSLNGAPSLKGRKLSEEKIEDVYSGNAKEAIDLFPKNVNVAVATALATRGVKNTHVIIKSIPNMKSNKHEIKAIGDTIKVSVTIESTPSANNPKSSTLAAYSVIALLKNLVAPITF